MIDSQSASLSWCQALSGAKDQIYVSATQLQVCWCGVLSLSRGCICCLQLRLAVASAVILRSESRRTRDHILLSQIRNCTSRVKPSLMLQPTISRPVCLGIMHTSGAYDQIFITIRQLWVCWCGALSLMRRWVCHLQLLLVLASAVILRSESRGTRNHILLCQIRDFPFRSLLWLAGLQWRYSTLPPHGILPLVSRWSLLYSLGSNCTKTLSPTVLSLCIYSLLSNGSLVWWCNSA
jgi:hypothetical protein